jgi:hypothetical protein
MMAASAVMMTAASVVVGARWRHQDCETAAARIIVPAQLPKVYM